MINIWKVKVFITKKKKSHKLIIFFSWFLGKGVLVAPVDSSPDAPGELGKPVVLPTNMTEDMKKTVDEGWVNNAFNQYASDLISVHRSLPDPRDPW